MIKPSQWAYPEGCAKKAYSPLFIFLHRSSWVPFLLSQTRRGNGWKDRIICVQYPWISGIFLNRWKEDYKRKLRSHVKFDILLQIFLLSYMSPIFWLKGVMWLDLGHSTYKVRTIWFLLSQREILAGSVVNSGANIVQSCVKWEILRLHQPLLNFPPKIATTLMEYFPSLWLKPFVLCKWKGWQRHHFVQIFGTEKGLSRIVR